MKAINILWDTDSKEELEQLPKEIEIPSFIKENEDAISDYITDKTGFCHKGFVLLKDYYIPVTWQVWDKVKIESSSLKEAIKYVKEHIDEIPLGTEPEYIDGSYQIDDGDSGEATVEETLQHLKKYWNLGGEYDESELYMNNIDKITQRDNSKYIGDIVLSDRCIVSDPCYLDPSWGWCTMTNMLPGNYHCFIKKNNDGLVSALYIYHEKYIREPKTMIDFIAVDSGQAGFYDRDYFLETRGKDDEEWNWYKEICSLTYHSDSSELTGGTKDKKCCVSSSGDGDGSYPLLIHRNSKEQIVSACIQYL